MTPINQRPPRIWRDSRGGEHLQFSRMIFTRCPARPGWCGVAAALFAIAFCIGYFWR